MARMPEVEIKVEKKLCDELAQLQEENAYLKQHNRGLLEACEAAKIALYHSAPSGCWATGPLTGDPIEDLVVCPGCRALTKIDAAIAKTRGGE